jgi:hypothetical protein
MALVKTTINIDEELLREAKLFALANKTSLSKIVNIGVAKEVGSKKKPMKELSVKKRIEALKSVVGKYNLGPEEPYRKRSDLYDDHFERKFGIKMK